MVGGTADGEAETAVAGVHQGGVSAVPGYGLSSNPTEKVGSNGSGAASGEGYAGSATNP